MSITAKTSEHISRLNEALEGNCDDIEVTVVEPTYKITGYVEITSILSKPISKMILNHTRRAKGVKTGYRTMPTSRNESTKKIPKLPNKR